MKRLSFLVLAVLAGCSRLQPGLRKNAVVLEAQAADAEAAKRAVVEKALALYVPPASAKLPEVERRILERPGDFIKRSRVVGESKGSVTLRAEVQGEPLAGALDNMNLIKPDGVLGRPKIFISLRETFINGGSRDVGIASDALRRALAARGYQALDFSDKLGRKSQKTGTAEEARAESAKLGADAVLTGAARSEPVKDERLQGMSSWRGLVEGTLEVGGQKLPVAGDAGAVDMAAEAAAAKALENAGMLAGEKLADDLRTRFKERVELALYVIGLDKPERVAGFIEALRGLKGVVAASPSRLNDEELRLRVFAEGLGAEDLAAELIQLRDFPLEVRGVDPAARAVEIEVRGS